MRRRQSSSSACETLLSSQSLAFLQELKGERSSDHARQTGEFVRSRGKLPQPSRDDGVHPRTLQPRAHTLDDKQRIPARGPEDLAETTALERLRGFQARQLGRLFGIERLERNLGHRTGLPEPREEFG